MSEHERRLNSRRAVSIAACAAAFAVGGPLVSYRFDAQKTEEAYRADAVRLALKLAHTTDATVEAAAARSRADAPHGNWLQSVSFTVNEASGQHLADIASRGRDEAALTGLTGLGMDRLNFALNEQTELDCLATAVYYEARSESTRGQIAVAEVIMNRVSDPRFPKTVCGVVYQGGGRNTGCQFSFTCDGSTHKKPRGQAWDRAKAVALHVQLGLSAPVTNKATHYHTDYVDPVWSSGLVETVEIGTHIFYRFPKTRNEWSVARANLAAEQLRREELVLGPQLVSEPATPADMEALTTAVEKPSDETVMKETIVAAL